MVSRYARAILGRLMRWLRKGADRVRKRFYEGPVPPARLGVMVDAFAMAHPRATREEWIYAMRALVDEAYKSGYIRGVEWRERTGYEEPDVAAFIRDHQDDWPWQPYPPGTDIPNEGEEVRDGYVRGVIEQTLSYGAEIEQYARRKAQHERLGLEPEPDRKPDPTRRTRGH